MSDIIVAKKYIVDKRLGEGSFGKVHSGRNKNNGNMVAMKFEKANIQKPKLRNEFHLLRHLQNDNIGIPRLMWFGEQDRYTILVTELLGYSLDDLIRMRKRFSLKTTLMLGIQMLNIISYVHSKGVLYRDMKPDNFLMKSGSPSELYIIDFGLSRFYVDDNNNHIPKESGKGFVGTARYSSVRSHTGITQSRRDDIESMLHVLIYLLKGKLPWQKATGSTKKERYDNIYKIKKELKPYVLCSEIPDEFRIMIEYARSLKFHESPSYVYLSDLMNTMMINNGETFDWNYDWTISSF